MVGFPFRGNETPIDPERVLVVGFSVLAGALIIALTLSFFASRHCPTSKPTMSTECSPGGSLPGLPFPGGKGGESMQYIVINTDLSKDRLKDLCRSFGLPQSGNKAALDDRLRKFSNDRDKWAPVMSVSIASRPMHRGPKMKTGKLAKMKTEKESTRRANEVFTTRPGAPVPHLPYALPTPAKPPTAAEHEARLEWARAITMAHPYVSREGEAHLRKSGVLKRPSVSSLAYPAQEYPERSAQLAQLLTLWSGLANPATNNSILIPHPSPAASAWPPAGSNPPPAPAQTQINSEAVLMAPTPPTATSTAPTPTRTITMAHEKMIKFTEHDVGPPPAVSFVDDLPRLNRMWDDTSEHWGGKSALIIKGTPIPIVYWKQVYMQRISGPSWMPGQWSLIKGSWAEWELVVTRWREYPEEEAFWRRFSDSSGKKLSYTNIVKVMKEDRRKADARLADIAKSIYATNFNEVFGYKKNGKEYVLKKEHDIAKRFLSLQQQGSV